MSRKKYKVDAAETPRSASTLTSPKSPTSKLRSPVGTVRAAYPSNSTSMAFGDSEVSRALMLSPTSNKQGAKDALSPRRRGRLGGLDTSHQRYRAILRAKSMQAEIPRGKRITRAFQGVWLTIMERPNSKSRQLFQIRVHVLPILWLLVDLMQVLSWTMLEIPLDARNLVGLNFSELFAGGKGGINFYISVTLVGVYVLVLAYFLLAFWARRDIGATADVFGSYMALLATVLYVPTLTHLASTLYCPVDEQGIARPVNVDATERCFEGRHLVMSVLSLGSIAIFIPFGLFVSQNTFDPDKLASHVLRRRTGRFQLIYLPSKILMVLIGVFISAPEEQPVRLIIMTGAALIVMTCFMMSQPYHVEWVNSFHGGLLATALISAAIGQSKANMLLQGTWTSEHDVVWLISLPLITLVSALAIHRRNGIDRNQTFVAAMHRWFGFLDIGRDMQQIDELHLAYLLEGANRRGRFARWLHMQQRYDEARAFYRLALEADQDHAGNIGNYALFKCDVDNNVVQARLMIERALKVDPTNPTNLAYAGYLLTKLFFPNPGIEEAGKAGAAPQSPHATSESISQAYQAQQRKQAQEDHGTSRDGDGDGDNEDVNDDDDDEDEARKAAVDEIQAFYRTSRANDPTHHMFRGLYASSTENLAIVDLQGRVLDMNSSTMFRFKISDPNTFRGTQLLLHAPEMQPIGEASETLAQHYLNEVHYVSQMRFPWRFRAPNGAEFSAEVLLNLQDSDVAQTGHAQLIQVSMTETSNIRAVREAETQLRRILNAMDQPCLRMSSAGVITSFNSAACALLGYQPEQVIGRSINVLLQKSKQRKHDLLMHKMMKQEESIRSNVHSRPVLLVNSIGTRVSIRIKIVDISSTQSRSYLVFLMPEGTLGHVSSRAQIARNMSSRMRRAPGAVPSHVANESSASLASMASHEGPIPSMMQRRRRFSVSSSSDGQPPERTRRMSIISAHPSSALSKERDASDGESEAPSVRSSVSRLSAGLTTTSLCPVPQLRLPSTENLQAASHGPAASGSVSHRSFARYGDVVMPVMITSSTALNGRHHLQEDDLDSVTADRGRREDDEISSVGIIREESQEFVDIKDHARNHTAAASHASIDAGDQEVRRDMASDTYVDDHDDAAVHENDEDVDDNHDGDDDDDDDDDNDDDDDDIGDDEEDDAEREARLEQELRDLERAEAEKKRKEAANAAKLAKMLGASVEETHAAMTATQRTNKSRGFGRFRRR